MVSDLSSSKDTEQTMELLKTQFFSEKFFSTAYNIWSEATGWSIVTNSKSQDNARGVPSWRSYY